MSDLKHKSSWSKFSDSFGEKLSWLLLIMAGLTFLIVVFRYVFGFSQVWLQELIIYLHASLIFLSVAYTMKHSAHVKVDVFYEKYSKAMKNRTQLLGHLFLLLPTVLLIGYVSFPYVINSWEVLEGSQDSGGIQGVFFLKTLLLAFVVLMTGQLIFSVKQILQQRASNE